MENVKFGLTYEYKAAEYLKGLGYTILDKNVNYPKIGELDIVALDKKELVFVEVKYRTTNTFGHPIESLTRPKVQKIVKAAKCYLLETNYKYNGIRFDVVCYLGDEVEHIKNAFYGHWN
jgi:putative endonuclease